MYRNTPGPDDTASPIIQDGYGAAVPSGSLSDLLQHAFEFVRRHYLPILTCIIFGLGAGFAYLRVAPPTYKATTKVLIENQRITFVQQQSFISESAVDQAQLENQVQILKSKPIAMAVIEKLKLATAPDFNGSMTGLLSSVTRLVAPYFTQEPNPTPRAVKAASDDLIAAFEARLTGSRVGMSNVIEISYSSSSPVRAAQIANAVAEAYLSEQLDAKYQANRTAVGWLQKRLAELGKQALDSERAVNQFRARHNVVTVAGNSVDDQQVGELNTRLIAARARTSEALARLNRYESVLRPDPARKDISNADLDAPFTDTLTNPIINSLRQQYLELARRDTEWTARLGAKHLAVVNLRAKMRDIRTSIAGELRRLAETSRNDYVTAKQSGQAIAAQLVRAVSQSQATNSTEATMRELEMNAKSYRSLYDSFLQQQIRTLQQQSFPIADARVISPALPPQGKSKPKPSLIIAFALAAGGALGLAFGFFRDLTDRTFRTTAQVESHLDSRCVSMVPLVEDSHSGKRLSSVNQQSELALRQRAIVQGPERFWKATGEPLSNFAESIRFIRLAIDQTPSGAPCKVIGITSSVANEGKSTIAAATAALIAQSGKRVIVVDCDFRNPTLSRTLTPRAESGLVDVVTKTRILDDVIWRDAKTKLAFLPVGNRPSPTAASDILSAEATQALFAKLRANYDYIIVDLPPLAPIVDVRATTPWIDGFILAIEWGRTEIDVVRQALHRAPEVNEALLGVVLNKTDMKALRRFDGRQSYGYYAKEPELNAA